MILLWQKHAMVNVVNYPLRSGCSIGAAGAQRWQLLRHRVRAKRGPMAGSASLEGIGHSRPVVFRAALRASAGERHCVHSGEGGADA